MLNAYYPQMDGQDIFKNSLIIKVGFSLLPLNICCGQKTELDAKLRSNKIWRNPQKEEETVKFYCNTSYC